jgi:DNA-binding IclR family transcriptional regulator
MVLVIVKALDILEYLAQDPEKTYTLSQIAEALQMNQATCVNILQTLASKNYVEHAGRKKGYRLGPMAYNLTNNPSYNQNLVSAAKEVMEELTRTLNETSLLGVLRNHKRFILHLVHSDQDLQVRSRTERNVYETASGRVLLAYLSTKELDNFLQVNGLPPEDIWQEASTRVELEAALLKIKAKELAITHSKTHIIGLAVPIQKKDRVIAALSIFLPEIRFSAARKKEILQALRQSVATIQERLQDKE